MPRMPARSTLCSRIGVGVCCMHKYRKHGTLGCAPGAAPPGSPSRPPPVRSRSPPYGWPPPPESPPAQHSAASRSVRQSISQAVTQSATQLVNICRLLSVHRECRSPFAETIRRSPFAIANSSRARHGPIRRRKR
eukprot:3021378-Pyramimonas_sp.AAC.1